jgi:hypothetical protein
MSDQKRPFLVAYDYGMGGLWGVMLAHDEQEIAERYPELIVVHERPPWMTDELHRDIWEGSRYDVDGPVTGMLEAVVADRERG